MGNRQAARLSRVEADEIARAWRYKRAEFSAACASVGDGAFDPTPRVEWIDLMWAPDDVPSELQAARAAAVVWFALSCCRGYSKHENAEFWRSTIPDKWWPGSITSWRYMAADRVAHPFHRIRINPAVGHEEKTVRDFLGAVRPSDNLHKVLRKLKPFVSEERWRDQQVDIAIRGVDVKTLVRVLADVQLQRGDEQDKDAVWLNLSAVYLAAEDESDVGTLLDVVDVDVYVDEVLRHSKAGTCLRTIEPDLLASKTTFPNLVWDQRCSALPYSRSNPQELGFVESGEEDIFKAAWIGYALFHPEVAARGTLFSSLHTYFSRCRGSVVDTLRLMATGNNLLSAMGESETPVAGYVLARLRAGAAISSVQVGRNPELKIIFDDEVWVTLCEPFSDLAALPPQVRVVIPGFGIQRVAKESIVECVARDPSPSSVKRLGIRFGHSSSHVNNFTEGTFKLLLKLIEILNGSFTSLEIFQIDAMSVDMTLDLLRACPQLETLSISHDGSCWSDPSAIQQLSKLPHLKELELQIGRLKLQALAAPQLEAMTTLHVYAGRPYELEPHRDSLRAILARYPRLECLTCGVRVSKHDQSFKSGLEGLSVLGDVTSGVHDVALVPLDLNARVAFLSGLRHLDKSGRLPEQLTPDVSQLIFSFASSTVLRRYMF